MSQSTPGNVPRVGSSVAIGILGMHRSGTSALTRVLNLLGVELGDHLCPARRDNPTGFWEDERIVQIHDQILDALGSRCNDILPSPDGWVDNPAIRPKRQELLNLIKSDFADRPLWGFKDPRACRVVPLWEGLLRELNVSPRFVLTIRQPIEIARSLAVRSGHSLNKSLLLTLTHMLSAEADTRAYPRLIVNFDQLFADWRGTVDRIARSLGLRWPIDPQQAGPAIEEFLNPQMRHHYVRRDVAPDLDPWAGADPAVVAWVRAQYRILCSAAEGTGKVDTAALDQINAEFKYAIPRLRPWRESKGWEYAEFSEFIVHENQRLKAEVERLNRELERQPSAGRSQGNQSVNTNLSSSGTRPSN